MKDERFEKALEQQRNRQKGTAFTRYFDLLGESVQLIKNCREFIADMHVQNLDNGFEGLDRLKDAVDELDDAQRALNVRMDRVGGNETGG